MTEPDQLMAPREREGGSLNNYSTVHSKCKLELPPARMSC